MKSYFQIFRRFILRSMRQSPLRSTISALGVSLGVAVMIAIRLANVSALDSFRAATESIAGETSIQITGAAGRFDQLLARDLEWISEYGQASPVVSGYAIIETGPGTIVSKVETFDSVSKATKNAGEYIQVLGVDIVRDSALRRYKLLQPGSDSGEADQQQIVLLMADPQSVILTEKFARRFGLEVGSRVALFIGDQRREFIIRSLLGDEGPARALDGRFALMDIGVAQAAFGRAGQLDRLDVKLAEGVSLEQAESEIAARLPAGLEVTRPDRAYGQVEKMIAAFHFNLNALGSIALIVGLFLIYNTVSISVITRRAEIGILRAMGAGRRLTLALFLGEALLLALAGTLVGLLLGRLMAGFAVRATATTVETFYIASVAKESAASHSLGLFEILISFAVALPLSLIAAALPAIEASRVRPVEAIRGAQRLASGFRLSRRHIVISIALLAAGFGLSRLDAIGGLPLFGYLAGLALMFGGALLAPNALWIACRAVGDFFGRLAHLFKAETKMASANLRGAIPRVSISVAALAISLAMMVSVSILIGSFRETVTYWVDQTLVADLYAKPATRTTAIDEGRIPAEAIDLIKSDPRVVTVDTFASTNVRLQDNTITLGAGDFGVMIEHGRLLFKQPSDARERIREAIGKDAVVVSESFALRFDKRPGDVIDLPTAAGAKPFRIAAVYYDYSNTRGVAVMDQTTYARHFASAEPSSLSIYLKEGVSQEEASEALARAASRYQLIFTTNGAVRREVRRIFDSSFSITYALEAIAIAIAALGVISTLITLILERRGEIAVLGMLGATRQQIRRMIVIEAVMIGGVSQSIGIIIGTMLSFVLIYVINVQSFGWTLQFHMPWAFLGQSTLLILAVTAIAGFYPATRAAGLSRVRVAGE